MLTKEQVDARRAILPPGWSLVRAGSRLRESDWKVFRTIAGSVSVINRTYGLSDKEYLESALAAPHEYFSCGIHGSLVDDYSDCTFVRLTPEFPPKARHIERKKPTIPKGAKVIMRTQDVGIAVEIKHQATPRKPPYKPDVYKAACDAARAFYNERDGAALSYAFRAVCAVIRTQRDTSLSGLTGYISRPKWRKIPKLTVRQRRSGARDMGIERPMFRVTFIRKASVYTGDWESSRENALHSARSKLRAERVRNAPVQRSGWDIIGGVRREPGWFLAEMNRRLTRRLAEPKVPKTDDRHLGVEIECIVQCTRADLGKKFVAAGLASYVSIGSDGSIVVSRGEGEPVEIRLCFPEAETARVVKGVCAVLNAPEVKAEVNTSCGLHVHLDFRRKRDEAACAFARLVAAQNLLFAMVPASRRNNDYCQRNTSAVMPTGHCDRYRAINADSFQKYQTLEVRLHSGSCDETKIINWITLLLAIARGKKFKRFPTTLASLSKQLGLSPELHEYVQRRLREFAADPEKVPFVTPLKRTRRAPALPQTETASPAV